MDTATSSPGIEVLEPGVGQPETGEQNSANALQAFKHQNSPPTSRS